MADPTPAHDPRSAEPFPAAEVRLSDAERTQALDALSSHFVEGRLDLAEFDVRSGDVTAARTLGQLEPAFAGLPGGSPLELGPDGRPRAKTTVAVAVPTAAQSERDLRALARKGQLVERIEAGAGAATLALFFLLMFVFGVRHAWVVWPLFGVGVIVARSVLNYGDEDEDAYEKIKAEESQARSERLKIALERRRELDGPGA